MGLCLDIMMSKFNKRASEKLDILVGGNSQHDAQAIEFPRKTLAYRFVPGAIAIAVKPV